MFLFADIFRTGFLASLESEDVSGRTQAEIERVLYVRVKNFDFLERANGAERQEQWTVKVKKTEENAGSGSMRVRKIINLRDAGAAAQYVFTSKLDVGNAGGSAETSEASSKSQFNVFKYLANNGMLKDRYIFNIENSDLVWEVDCFPKPGELYHPWVKIDLEGLGSGKELPALPMEFEEMIDGTRGQVSDENDAKISRMYETMFLLKNTNEPLSDYSKEEEEEENAGKAQGGEDPDDIGNAEGSDNEEDDPSGDNAGSEGEGGGDGEETDGAPNEEGGEEGENADGQDEGSTEEGGEEEGSEGEQVEASKEAFSSAAQTFLPLVPIVGPLITVIYGQRSGDLGGVSTSQHTNVTRTHVDSRGGQSKKVDVTGSYNLTDMTDAKDYIKLLEEAVGECKRNLKNVENISMTLWPQRDGKFSIFDIKTDRSGQTHILTKNNPGKLKWWSTSLAGKRIIRLSEYDIERFRFNNRTISCPYDGQIVEFDVGQLRAFKYQTKPKGGAYEIVDFNFDL